MKLITFSCLLEAKAHRPSGHSIPTPPRLTTPRPGALEQPEHEPKSVHLPRQPQNLQDDSGVFDPLQRHLSQAPIGFEPESPQLNTPARAPEPIDELMLKLVRRIAFGGDRDNGTARLEIGSGSLAGSVIVVRAEGRSLCLDLELPAGAEAAGFPERIQRRLQRLGYDVRELNVR